MKVFWSWQNDAEPGRHRHFIKAALEKAIEEVALELNLNEAERPEIDHDTKSEKGAVLIADTIMRKIAESAAFVADVTPISRSPGGKALPNPNVMIELGWALNRPGFERHIYVMNTGDGFSAEDLPFDIRGRLVMTYDLPTGADKKAKEGASRKLTRELAYALRTNLEDHLDEEAAATQIVRVAAREGDPSIWASAGETLSHHDSMKEGGQAVVRLVDGPRAYMRVSPAGWRKGSPPMVGDVERYDFNFSVQAPADGVASGDSGATQDGFAQYWLTGKDTAANVSMFLDETGEFWVLHGTAVHDNTLGVASVMRMWASTLRRANFFFDFHHASPVRQVEVGVVGIKDVRWPGNYAAERRPSRKSTFSYEAVDRNWTSERQREFLIEAYTRLSDLFGWRRPTVEEAGRLVDANDRDRHLTPP